ncbi:hypothetical protein [Lysobacter sp. TAB13]
MTTKTLPVPPENRSDKGPGGNATEPVNQAKERSQEGSDKTGRHANIRQNTTNQGYQQDR